MRRSAHDLAGWVVYAGVNTNKELHAATVIDAAETVLGTRSFVHHQGQ